MLHCVLSRKYQKFQLYLFWKVWEIQFELRKSDRWGWRGGARLPVPSLRPWTSFIQEQVDGVGVNRRYAIRRRSVWEGLVYSHWLSVEPNASLGEGYARVTPSILAPSMHDFGHSFGETLRSTKWVLCRGTNDAFSVALSLFLLSSVGGSRLCAIGHSVSRNVRPRHYYTCVCARCVEAAAVRACVRACCTRVRENAWRSTQNERFRRDFSFSFSLRFIPHSKHHSEQGWACIKQRSVHDFSNTSNVTLYVLCMYTCY